LQGGTHLILQVQVQEAIAQETDTTVDRVTTALRAKNVRYDEVRRIDDTHILIHNIEPSQYSVLSDLQSTQYNNVWYMSPAPGRSGASARPRGNPKAHRWSGGHARDLVCSRPRSRRYWPRSANCCREAPH